MAIPPPNLFSWMHACAAAQALQLDVSEDGIDSREGESHGKEDHGGRQCG